MHDIFKQETSGSKQNINKFLELLIPCFPFTTICMFDTSRKTLQYVNLIKLTNYITNSIFIEPELSM
jgi:hypothetical protein